MRNSAVLYETSHSRETCRALTPFLLLHPSFPRSVRCALEATATALRAIQGAEDSPADRLLGRLLGELRYGEVRQLLAGNLHHFLESIVLRCSQMSLALQGQFALT